MINFPQLQLMQVIMTVKFMQINLYFWLNEFIA